MFGIRGLLICPFLLLLTFQITSCEQQNETAVGENTGRNGKGKQTLHLQPSGVNFTNILRAAFVPVGLR
jgi:hypothetical protein